MTVESSVNTEYKCIWWAKCVPIYDDGQTIDEQRKMKSAELDKQKMWMSYEFLEDIMNLVLAWFSQKASLNNQSIKKNSW
jgi:hypothetical protein